ncbi:N-acetyltransferase [Deinococcus metallilatus]|uniref:GNAT family N-acetyltransferase n=1 Tax=Deinococcus metallilatus TaxID=1211322 RepID=A0AAJ5K4N3_9DEIO|nr:GNAT family N-acetyltransferase [Deinococcus metallilatus]MBB5295919.1 GNAT superfamily N-acetyltransferase [Deinococcus metallilatus]QBY08247.1 N-acetyltransferase [Deinococcus metallilatus]RXJ11978.1 N-acetyltransferase [Deinococcus metallilatus]TLK25790.1 GNAT family N-acetyltransferase [Deinococcus metallilatus]GMA14547.1 GNAT family N-acetyltransferase [Deinococcus metallilatus]
MIRPMQATDAPDILALLHWMDDAPEREVFAPDARDVTELRGECEDRVCLVATGEDGEIRGYCALAPFRDGLALEGPLGMGDLHLLLARAVERAEGLPIYAFSARDNLAAREALEAAGFTPMHTTDFYAARVAHLARAARVPDGYTTADTLAPGAYRTLYRTSEDGWAGRLEWTDAEIQAHFARDDVRLVLLLRGGQPVGFAELELNAEAARADLTYLAVHPAERGQRLGRALLALAAAEAAAHPEIRDLRARAHDHARAARALYTHAGLTHCRSVVTYLRDDTEGEA